MAREPGYNRPVDDFMQNWDQGGLYSYGGPNNPQDYQVTKDRQDQAIAIALREREQARKMKRRGRF